MPELKFSVPPELLQTAERLEARLPDLKRAAVQKFGDKLLDIVRGEIAGRVNDSRGHVRSWQEKFVGSRGGYVAIRPTSSSTGKDSPGAVTRYLEVGHAIRHPSGVSNRYRPRIHVGRVAGRGFYAAATASAQTAGQQFLQELQEQLRKELEA